MFFHRALLLYPHIASHKKRIERNVRPLASNRHEAAPYFEAPLLEADHAARPSRYQKQFVPLQHQLYFVIALKSPPSSLDRKTFQCRLFHYN